LARTVRDGRHDEVVRKKVDGVWCYFPSDGGGNPPPPNDSTVGTEADEPESSVMAIWVPQEAVEVATMPVMVGKAHSNSEGIAWIVDNWLSENAMIRAELGQAVHQIEQIRARFSTTLGNWIPSSATQVVLFDIPYPDPIGADAWQTELSPTTFTM
jgi:hypothetical protein